jgi:murein L,D-transpeptidase YcbB/YkuD
MPDTDKEATMSILSRMIPTVLAVSLAMPQPAAAFPVEPVMASLTVAHDGLMNDLYPTMADAHRAAATASRIALNRDRVAASGFPVTGRYIIVNIPSMELLAYQDGDLVLSSPVVVGRPATPTPQMVSDLYAIKFNPDWTVPRSIGEEYVEKMRRGQFGFFSRRGIKAKRGRQVVPVRTVNPDTFFAEGYRFWQPPGDRNSLGRLKFELDNDLAIYLHDTNEPRLFAQPNRARSHGCIRVQNFLELAAWVGSTTVADVEAGIAARKTVISRIEPVPVFVTYFTALPDPDGTIRLFDDIYRLDGF